MTDERLDRLREYMDALDAEKEKAKKPALPVRRQLSQFVNTALFFLAVVLIAIRGVATSRHYHGWRNAGSDRSAREAYVTLIEVDVALLVLTIAAVVAAAATVRWWANRQAD